MIDFAATSRLAIFALLLLCLSPAAVLGVYKMVDQNTMLVPNHKPGVVYLFEYPRTQIGADQSPLNLKAECWLKLKGIKFHRLSNLLILGSHSKGAAPFAFYQESANHAGSYVDGSDAIITKFAPPIYESRIEDNAMSSLNAHISFYFFALLMVDRRTRDAQGKGGLDWMVAKDDQGRFKDQGLIQQFVPVLVNDRQEDAEKLKPMRTIKINGTQFQIALNPATWTAYFGVYNNCVARKSECEMEKVQFLEHFLTVNGAKSGHKFETGDWENVEKFMDDEIHAVLSKALKANGGGLAPSSEAKLDEMLKLRKIGVNGVGLDPEAPFSTLFVDPKSADPFSNPKVLDLLKDWLEEIFKRLEDNAFLGGETPFPADCSLFSMLVQFFETGLNIRELKQYFQPGGHLTANGQKLHTYMNKMKKKLGLENKWSELKQYPWPLNYEEPKIGEKFDGPFTLKTDSLVEIFARNGSLDRSQLSRHPEVQAAAEAVEKEFEKRNHDKKVENASREVENALRVMAAYLCGLGGGLLANMAERVKHCAATHLARAKFDESEKPKGNPAEDPNAAFKKRVRQVAYQAVVAYNEGLVRKNILPALGVAKAKNSANNMFDGNEW